MISLPFGPGKAVLISGRLGGAMVLLDIMRSPLDKQAGYETVLFETTSLDKESRDASLSVGER
jgi:hypothetical protein